MLDRLGGDAARFGGLLAGDRAHGLSVAPIDQPLLDHRFEHGHRHEPFGAGGVANPAVGVRGGQRLPGLDVNERPGPAAGEAVRSREAARVPDVRQPGLEEIGAEGKHDFGIFEGVVRHRVAAKDLTVRRADRLVTERLEGHAWARAHALHPTIEQGGLAAVLELRDGRDGMSLVGFAKLADLVGDALDGVIP